MPALIEAPTPLGSFYVSATPAGVLGITFPSTTPERHFNRAGQPFDDEGMDVATAAAKEIDRYVSGQLKHFSVAVDFSFVTAFRRDVYQALMQVPFGETVTYGDLAYLSGHPGSARAVGTAMKNNPVPLIIPCHRVVGAGNAMGGWSGPEGMKEVLLSLERR
jgi:methylated-DNA-[protein]-cysteine S-methyltransferase